MEWKKLLISPKLLKRWSGRWGSNPRRPAWEAGISTTEVLPLAFVFNDFQNQFSS